MSDKFQNQYRITSTRLQNWDYGWAAAYFVTICTQNKECYFGDIIDGNMQYSPLGAIANVLWYEIKNHTKNIELDVYQVMPNHIHGIIVINKNNDKTEKQNVNNDGDKGDIGNAHGTGAGNKIMDGNGDGNGNVETRHALSLQSQQSKQSKPPSLPNKTIGQQRFQNQGKNTLSSIVGSYKSAITKHANRLGFNFAWQSRFHDHIIRDQESYERIRKYIINNPANWDKDKFYK